MYESFYQLKEKPFNLTPDPKFIYFTEKHCEALANLVYGIRERKGFLVLSGEVGTGKTTLVHALLDTLDRTGVLSAFIFNPILTSSEFFEFLLADLNLKADARSKSQCLIKLNALLLERYRSGQMTVLIVDEAQNLSPELLEEIRLLTNLETSTEKLLQIVLAGQPELSLKLNSPDLRQLKQRISLRCHLEPLALQEVREYVRTRLEIAGLPNQQIFPDACLAEIHRRTGGIPRLINTLCDNAMITGYACDRKVITLEILDEVADDLEIFVEPGDQAGITRGARFPGSPRNWSGNEEKSAPLPTDRAAAGETGKDSKSFDLFVQFVDNLRGQNS